jgi:tetratricopeptide (TPR) repeat protein
MRFLGPPAALAAIIALSLTVACGGGGAGPGGGEAERSGAVQSRELSRAVESAEKALESGKVAEAIAQFSAAIESGATSAAAYGGRGTALIQTREYPQAIADLTRAIELDPKNDIYAENRAIARTELFKMNGDRSLLAEAILDAGAAAALRPDRIGPIFARGEAYYLNGDYEAALSDLKECVKRSDRFKRAWLLKGMTNLALGRPTDARADFEKVLKLDPSSPEASEAQAQLARLQ